MMNMHRASIRSLWLTLTAKLVTDQYEYKPFVVLRDEHNLNGIGQPAMFLREIIA